MSIKAMALKFVLAIIINCWKQDVSNYCQLSFFLYSFVIFTVHATRKRLKVEHDREKTAMVLEYLNMSCGVQHGNVLILGFSDGGVSILLTTKH